MKNLLNDSPDSELSPRTKESLAFVERADIDGKNVLDIGCGFGWFEKDALQRHVKSIAGIEIAESDLKAAKTAINDERATFAVAGATKLPFADESFDTVVSWEVIEHIPKNTEKTMFAEVNRVLANNGIFYLSTPYDSFLSKVLDPAWWLIAHRHYSTEHLTAFARESGFVIEEVMIKGGIVSLTTTLNMYFSKWVLRRKPLLNTIFRSWEQKEYDSGEGYANIFVKFRKAK